MVTRVRLRPEDTIRFAVAAADSPSRLFVQTIAPDTTLIPPSGEDAPHKHGVNVQDLLDFHFPPWSAVQPNAGSTCWQVHDPSGEVNPCTEDGIFAIVGPETPSKAGHATRLDSAAPVALEKVSSSSKVRERLSQEGTGTYRYRLDRGA